MMPQYDAAQTGALSSLVLTALAIMGSPGPSTTSLVASVVAYGMRRSVPYAAGLVAGALLVLVAIATGITAALLAVPAIHTALLIVAIGYILWLAYRLATAPPPVEQKVTTPPPAEQTAATLPIAEVPAAKRPVAAQTPARNTTARNTAAGRRPSFIDGAVLGFVNPKAWIAISAVFASAQLASTAIANAVLKIAVLTCMVALIHAIWLLAGRLLMPFLRHPRRARAVNVALAGVLVITSMVGLLS